MFSLLDHSGKLNTINPVFYGLLQMEKSTRASRVILPFLQHIFVICPFSLVFGIRKNLGWLSVTKKKKSREREKEKLGR